MKKKSALILGGNRFFGRHLAIELLRRDVEVTLLNRGQLEDGLGNSVKRLVADRSDETSLAASLAAAPATSGSSDWDFVFDQICYNGRDAAILAKLMRGRVGRLVFTSTQSVYGTGFGLRETDFDPSLYVAPEPRDESYAGLKREAEATYCRILSFELALVRIPIVLGLDDYTRRLHWHIDRVARKLPIHLPNGEARMGFVRSDVVGRLIAEVAMTSLTGPINLASPGETSVRDVVALIERETGQSAVLTTNLHDDRGEPATSPFGVSEDWTMNLDRMKENGLAAPSLDSWLPELVTQLTEASRIQSGART